MGKRVPVIRLLFQRAALAAKQGARAMQHGLTDEPLAGLGKQGHGENGLCLLWKLAVDLWHGRRQ